VQEEKGGRPFHPRCLLIASAANECGMVFLGKEQHTKEAQKKKGDRCQAVCVHRNITQSGRGGGVKTKRNPLKNSKKRGEVDHSEAVVSRRKQRSLRKNKILKRRLSSLNLKRGLARNLGREGNNSQILRKVRTKPYGNAYPASSTNLKFSTHGVKRDQRRLSCQEGHRQKTTLWGMVHNRGRS